MYSSHVFINIAKQKIQTWAHIATTIWDLTKMPKTCWGRRRKHLVQGIPWAGRRRIVQDRWATNMWTLDMLNTVGQHTKAYYRWATNRNMVHTLGQYREVYYRQATKIKWRKDSIINKWGWENWVPTHRGVKLDLYLAPLKKLTPNGSKMSIKTQKLKLVGKKNHRQNHIK